MITPQVLICAILVPAAFSAACIFIPRRYPKILGFLTLAASAVTFGFTSALFFVERPFYIFLDKMPLLRVDNLACFVIFFTGLFGILITIYSIGFLKGKDYLKHYYIYLLLTISASVGAASSNNLILFAAFWGFLAITLYLLINVEGEKATYAAKKTFIIVGGSDALVLLGIGIIWKLAGTFQIDQLSMPLNSGLAALAFLCLATGAFAKAGMMPLHTWVPESSEVAPLPVMAFLPASLDKLLGIYFLARISLDMFVMKPNSPMSVFLLALGALTILAAVMMALVQHNFKRLLSYHAVSQVGYMVLGIGTANPIGIAGGLFHMVNNAIYKSCLFLSGGAVEHRAKDTDLERLGGLAKFMPITFLSCLIAALAISGVPPFNGFVSKWMIYQGVIELGKDGGRMWVVWLIAAIFGSALTLASFMKLIHATFLGQRSKDIVYKGEIREAGISLWFPMATLAALCVVFGIWAYGIPLKNFVLPSIGEEAAFIGVWAPTPATLLIILGIAIGFIIYLLGTIRKARTSEAFIGGETLASDPDIRLSGAEFYNTVRDIGILRFFYGLAKKKFFDIYEVGTKLVLGFSRFLQYLHNGVLPTYLTWCLLGMMALIFIFLRK